MLLHKTKKIKMTDGMTVMEIVKIMYAEIPEQYHMQAAQNVNTHLTKLVKQNMVKQIENEKFIFVENTNKNKHSKPNL